MKSFIPPYAVLACAGVFFWSISIRSLFYTIMPTIAGSLQLSSSMATLVISLMLLGYCAASWVAGSLPGRRKVRILAGVLLSIPAAVLLSLSREAWMLPVAALALGLGIGLYLPLGLSLLVDLGGGHNSAYMAVHEFSATLASFSGSTFVAIALAWTDWHGALQSWSVVGILALLGFALVRDKGGQPGRHGARKPPPVGRQLVYGTISYGAVTVLLIGLISVLPLIMVRSWGLDQAEAASVIGNTRLAGLVGVLVAGVAPARWGTVRVVRAMQVISLVGGVAMSMDGYGPLFLAGTILLAVGAAGAVTLLPLVIVAAFPPGQREGAMSVAVGLGGLVGMVIFPSLFGFLLDAQLPSAPILLSTTGTLVAFLVTSRITVYRGAEEEIPTS